MNAERYIEILTRFMKRLRRVRPLFIHGNARPHTANIVKQFMAKKGVIHIEHPPFSPDLNPPDFLFPRLIFTLKGNRFDDISGIQQNAIMLSNSISKEDFLKSIQEHE
ncbi:UNVERIFIED_CONTAM: Histone-lysine N-methyltransferase SETMAR [Trichonephila clavipes]